MNRQRIQSGVSLVEVMVSVAVSAILLAGVVQIFISTRMTYQTMEGSSRLQEDGRFALNFLAQDLRQTGYYGCNGRQLSNDNRVPSAADWVDFYFASLDQPVAGFEPDDASDGWIPNPRGATSAFGTNLAGLVDATAPDSESDIFAVRVPITPPFQLAAAVGPNDSTFTVTVNSCDAVDDSLNDIRGGMALALADCQGATLVAADSVTCPTATTAAVDLNGVDVDRDFGAALTEVYGIGTRVYYVGESAQTDAAGNPVPTLYRIGSADQTTVPSPQELVPGVESMDVQYGIDTDDDGFSNRYIDADTVNAENAWNNVVAVRISLGMRTIDPVGAPGDGYLRHQYTSTIVLRNRLPVN